MNICFTTLGCPDWTIEEVCRKAVEMKVFGVELRAKAPDLHINTETPAQRVREIRTMFEDAGIAIAGITGYTRFADSSIEVRRENEDQLRRNLELCASLGADYVRTFIGFPEGDRAEEACAYIGESLHRACIASAGIPAKALIETHDFASTGAATRKLINAAGNCSNLGAIWDISHPPKGGETPEQTWSCIGAWVQSVHIKDEYAERLPNGEIHQCMPGEGVLPLLECLRLLKDEHYDGYYVIEWERAFNMNLAPLDIAVPAFRDYLLQHG